MTPVCEKVHMAVFYLINVKLFASTDMLSIEPSIVQTTRMLYAGSYVTCTVDFGAQNTYSCLAYI
jgi:hypothetical protein